MTSVRVLHLPSIIKAMVRASKSLMVVGWGGCGLFDYSVSPGPFWTWSLTILDFIDLNKLKPTI